MSRSCTVCAHPQRDAIDRALVDGTSARKIAALYRVSDDAVIRHRHGHLPTSVAESQTKRETERSQSLLDQVDELWVETNRLKHKAEQKNDLRTALAAIRDLTRLIELTAKLRGEMSEQRESESWLSSPKWLKVRESILRALEPYPDACRAVIEVLSNGNAKI